MDEYVKIQLKKICINYVIDCAVFAANFPFANELNSMARLTSGEQA